MGSRLNLSLSCLIGNPNISVELKTTNLAMEGEPEFFETTAHVSFKSQYSTTSEWSFDVSRYDGKIELSCDFNFFRYTKEDSKVILLQNLYSYGIDFRVTH